MLADLDFQLLFESAPGLYLVLQPDLRIVAVSNAYLAATMTRREEIVGRDIFEVFPDNPEDHGATGSLNLRASFESVLRTGTPHTMALQKYDIRQPASQGGQFEERFWSPTNSPVLVNGQAAYIIHRVEDVTDVVRKQKINDELKAEAESIRSLLFDRNLAGICRLTEEGEVLDCNEGLARMLGYQRKADLFAEGPALLRPLNNDWNRIFSDFSDTEALSNVDLCFAARDGRIIWTLANLNRPAGAMVEAIFLDVTERKAVAEQVEFQANHDSLTQLPNRLLFRDRLSRAVADRRWLLKGLAVLFVDVDGFKGINDRFGHDVGDWLLKEMAERLVAQVRSSDTIARVGGDEFALILSGIRGRDNVANVARNLVDRVARTFQHDQFVLRVTVSVGIAVAPDDGIDGETLLRKADEAMYLAKSSGKNAFRFAIAERDPDA